MLSYKQTSKKQLQNFTRRLNEKEISEMLVDFHAQTLALKKFEEETKAKIAVLKEACKYKKVQTERLAQIIEAKANVVNQLVYVRLYEDERRVEYVDDTGAVLFARAALPNEKLNLFDEPDVEPEFEEEKKVTKITKKLNKNGFPIVDQASASEVLS